MKRSENTNLHKMPRMPVQPFTATISHKMYGRWPQSPRFAPQWLFSSACVHLVSGSRRKNKKLFLPSTKKKAVTVAWRPLVRYLVRLQRRLNSNTQKSSYHWKTERLQSTHRKVFFFTENRGKGNSAKEEQKPVTTVALDRVCVRAWLRHVWRCMRACICQENVYVKEKMCIDPKCLAFPSWLHMQWSFSVLVFLQSLCALLVLIFTRSHTVRFLLAFSSPPSCFSSFVLFQKEKESTKKRKWCVTIWVYTHAGTPSANLPDTVLWHELVHIPSHTGLSTERRWLIMFSSSVHLPPKRTLSARRRTAWELRDVKQPKVETGFDSFVAIWRIGRAIIRAMLSPHPSAIFSLASTAVSDDSCSVKDLRDLQGLDLSKLEPFALLVIM